MKGLRRGTGVSSHGSRSGKGCRSRGRLHDSDGASTGRLDPIITEDEPVPPPRSGRPVASSVASRPRSRRARTASGDSRSIRGRPLDDLGRDDLQPAQGAGHQGERGEAVEPAGIARRGGVEPLDGAGREGGLVASRGGELGRRGRPRRRPGSGRGGGSTAPRGSAGSRAPRRRRSGTLQDGQPGLGMGIEVDQALQVEPVGGIGQVLAVVDRQDDPEALPAAEPDRLVERLPAPARGSRPAGRDGRGPRPGRRAAPRRRPGCETSTARRQGPRVSARARARTVDLPSPAPARTTARRWPVSIVSTSRATASSCGATGTYGDPGAQERVARQLPVPLPHGASASRGRSGPNGHSAGPADRAGNPTGIASRSFPTIGKMDLEAFAFAAGKDGWPSVFSVRISRRRPDQARRRRVAASEPGPAARAGRRRRGLRRRGVGDAGRGGRASARTGSTSSPWAIRCPIARRACRLTLATAVPKGERFDWLVEKATELGVDRLVPIVTERSVVDPRAAKLDRLRRVIVEASKQCGRNRLMDARSARCPGRAGWSSDRPTRPG